MSKSRVVAEKQPQSTGGRRFKRSSLGVYLLVGGLALAGLVLAACGGQSPGRSQSREFSPVASSPSSGAPLNAAAIDNPAPGFSLPNQYSQTYTLTPGDGKNHVLVFYMGNF